MEHVNDSSFAKEVLTAKGLVIADFWAAWCGPCKRYGPIFEEFATANQAKAKFVKVDVEESQDIAAQLGVMSIPTTVIFKDGQEVAREVGILSKDMLASIVAEFA